MDLSAPPDDVFIDLVPLADAAAAADASLSSSSLPDLSPPTSSAGMLITFDLAVCFRTFFSLIVPCAHGYLPSSGFVCLSPPPLSSSIQHFSLFFLGFPSFPPSGMPHKVRCHRPRMAVQGMMHGSIANDLMCCSLAESGDHG